MQAKAAKSHIHVHSTRKEVAMEHEVFCRMAGCRITHGHCEESQSHTACIDCLAPTRRCTKCKRLVPIKDAQRGLCEWCLSKNGKKPASPDQRVVLDLEEVADRLKGGKTRVVQTPAISAEEFDPEQVVSEPSLKGSTLLDPRQPTAKAISKLPHLESKIIRLLIGLGTNAPLTLVGVADTLDLSQRETELHARDAIQRLKLWLPPKDFEALKKKLLSFPRHAKISAGAKPQPLTEAMDNEPNADDEQKPVAEEATITAPDGSQPPTASTDEVQPATEQTVQTSDEVAQAVNRLSERKAQIMLLQLGLEGNQPLTLREVSSKLELPYDEVVEAQTDAMMLLRGSLDPAIIQRLITDAQEAIRARTAAKPVAIPTAVPMVETVVSTPVATPIDVAAVAQGSIKPAADPSIVAQKVATETIVEGIAIAGKASATAAPKITEPISVSNEPRTSMTTLTAQDRIAQAIENLSPWKREVLQLRLGIGVECALTRKEIAAQLGVSHATVNSAQQDAMRQMTTELGQEDIAELKCKLAQTTDGAKRRVTKYILEKTPAAARDQAPVANATGCGTLQETSDTCVREAEPTNAAVETAVRVELVESQGAGAPKPKTTPADEAVDAPRTPEQTIQLGPKLDLIIAALQELTSVMRSLSIAPAAPSAIPNADVPTAAANKPHKTARRPVERAKSRRETKTKVRIRDLPIINSFGLMRKDGVSWGGLRTLTSRLRIPIRAILVAIRQGLIHSIDARNSNNTRLTLYSVTDVFRYCGKSIKMQRADEYSRITENETVYANLKTVAEMHGILPKALYERLDWSIRTIAGLGRNGPALFYSVTDINRLLTKDARKG